MACLNCQCEYSGVEMTQQGMIETCNGCGAVIPKSDAPKVDKTQPTVAVTNVPHPFVLLPDDAFKSEPARVQRPAQAPRKVDDKPLDVRKLARARLKELDREIARLTKLQRERDDLSRMLAASKQTDGPSVVPIRKLANQR